MKRYMSISGTIYEIKEIKPYSIILESVLVPMNKIEVALHILVAEFKRQYKIKANIHLARDFLAMSGSQLSVYVSRSKTNHDTDVSKQGALGVIHSLVLGLEVTKSMMLITTPSHVDEEDFDLA